MNAGKPFPHPKKIFDTHAIPKMGRVDRAWKSKLISNAFGQKRTGPEFAESFRFYDPEFVLKEFNMKALEFGNWLNQEDRYTYLAGTAISSYDMARCIGFLNSQIGIGSRLSIAHGARGRSSALAHFEPATFAINITRYSRASKWLRSAKYLSSGGVGAYGHEWAHALDFYLGRSVSNKAVNFLSQVFQISPVRGSEGVYELQQSSGSMESAMIDLMKILCLEPAKQKGQYRLNKYMGQLMKLYKEGKITVYWIRPWELFARAFEVFLVTESKRKKINNPYLRRPKYTSDFYPSEALARKYSAAMRKLLTLAKAKVPSK